MHSKLSRKNASRGQWWNLQFGLRHFTKQTVTINMITVLYYSFYGIYLTINNVSYLWRLVSLYRIAEKFQGRKLLRIGGKYDFHLANFQGLLAHAIKGHHAPNFMEKTLKFVKFFSLESFPLYVIVD